MHTNSKQLWLTGLLCEKLWIIIKRHSLCITLKVGKVAPPFVTDATNESQVKQSKLFPESPTNYTAVKMRIQWTSAKFQGGSHPSRFLLLTNTCTNEFLRKNRRKNTHFVVFFFILKWCVRPCSISYTCINDQNEKGKKA